MYVGEYDNGFKRLLLFDSNKHDEYSSNQWIFLRGLNEENSLENVSIYQCDLLNEERFNDIFLLLEALNNDVYISTNYKNRENYLNYIEGSTFPHNKSNVDSNQINYLANPTIIHEISSFRGGRKLKRKLKKTNAKRKSNKTNAKRKSNKTIARKK